MKMRDAAQSLSYDGVFVYVYGTKIEAMRVVHQVKEGVSRERIYAMNGAPREVIRDDKQVWCYVPEKKIGVREYRQALKQGFPSILPNQLEQLKSSYNFTFLERERIADRQTRIISVEPSDDLRYGYTLWADEETGLILKAALLDTDNKPIEQYMFTQVSIGTDVTDQALLPMTPKKSLAWFNNDDAKDVIDEVQKNSASDWQLNDIPKGFMLSQTIKRKSPVSHRMVEHFVYSDGLAAVSVFIEKMGSRSRAISGINRMGAVHAFGKVVDGYQVTVVGEVPAKTVGMIGESVALLKKH